MQAQALAALTHAEVLHGLSSVDTEQIQFGIR